MNAANCHAHPSGKRLRLALRGLATLLMMTAAPAWAVDTFTSLETPSAEPSSELRYALQGGLSFSDNRLRQSADPESDLFLDGTVGFTWLGNTPRLAWRGSGQLQTSQSLQGGRDEPPRAELALALDWNLVEQRLDWHVAQLAAVEQVDPLLADSPENRQQTYIFVTGPSLLFGTPSSWLARLNGRVALARADESPAFDHRRESVAASLERNSTPVMRWTLLAEFSDIFFRNVESNDFARGDLLLRGERRLRRGLLALAVGHTRIDRESAGSLQRPLWQARLEMATPTGGQLQVNYADTLTDAGRDLALLEDPAERLWQESRRARIDGSLYRLRNLDLAWREERARLGWSLAPFLRRVDYIDADAIGEGRSEGLRGGLAYRLSPRSTLTLDAGTARYRFVGVEREDRDRGLRLGAERQLAPRWFLRLAASRFLRDSSQLAASYAENLYSVSLLYRSDR